MTSAPPSRARRLAWIRHVNKRLINRVALTFAGRRVYAVLEHTGRRSGRVYRTPVVIARTPDGVVVPMTFGTGSDWHRNVKTAGGCTLIARGEVTLLAHPRLIGPAEALLFFPAWLRVLIRLMGTAEFLRLYTLAGEGQT